MCVCVGGGGVRSLHSDSYALSLASSCKYVFGEGLCFFVKLRIDTRATISPGLNTNTSSKIPIYSLSWQRSIKKWFLSTAIYWALLFVLHIRAFLIELLVCILLQKKRGEGGRCWFFAIFKKVLLLRYISKNWSLDIKILRHVSLRMGHGKMYRSFYAE